MLKRNSGKLEAMQQTLDDSTAYFTETNALLERIIQQSDLVQKQQEMMNKLIERLPTQ